MQFRVDISIRVRGQTPFEFREIKSEHYDTIEDYAEAIRDCVVDNIDEYIYGGTDNGTNDDE